MTTTLRTLAMLLLLSLAAQAQVLIYKGTLSAQEFPADSQPKLPSYFILDLGTSKYLHIYLITQRGKKMYVESQVTDYKRGSVLLPKGKTGSIIGSQVSYSNVSGDTFSYYILDFSGVNATLKVASTAGADPVSAPASLAYREREVTSARILSRTGALLYQSKLTQRENDLNHRLPQARDAVIAILTRQGYGPLM